MKTLTFKISLIATISILALQVGATDTNILSRKDIEASPLTAAEFAKRVFIGTSSLAGGNGDKGGNGADGLKDEKGRLQLLDFKKIPSTTLFTPQEDTDGWKLFVDKMKEFKFENMEHMSQRDDGTDSLDQKLIRTADELKWYLVNGPLPEINDSGVIVVKKVIKGQIVRLALQYAGNVFVDRSHFVELENEVDSRSGLYLHEILIRQLIEDKQQDIKSTERIAGFVNRVFGYSTDIAKILVFTSSSAYNSLCDMGIRVAPDLAGKTYTRYYSGISTFEFKIPNKFLIYTNNPKQNCDVFEVELNKNKKAEDQIDINSRLVDIHLTAKSLLKNGPVVHAHFEQFGEREYRGRPFFIHTFDFLSSDLGSVLLYDHEDYINEKKYSDYKKGSIYVPKVNIEGRR